MSHKQYFGITCLVLYVSCILDIVIAKHSFIASFQSDGSWSTDHWMKYDRKISNVQNEFTLCHWEKIRYFSPSINTIWTYCYITVESDGELHCWTLYQSINLESAGRYVDVVASSKSWSITAYAIQYKHRQWNHICFLYSMSKEIRKIYYNGELVKEEREGNFTRFENGGSVLDSAFVIGQEQDVIGGGYDAAQLLNGEISEFNMWNTLLSETEIQFLSKCQSSIRGNVITWKENNFKMNKVDIIDVTDPSFFCKKRKQLVVFPQQKSFQRAKSLCSIHGGVLAVPESKEEEDEIFNIVNRHKKLCLVAENHLQDGKAVWLGMEKLNRNWYLPNIDDDNLTQLVNYSNWDPTRCTTNDCGGANDGCLKRLSNFDAAASHNEMI